MIVVALDIDRNLKLAIVAFNSAQKMEKESFFNEIFIKDILFAQNQRLR